MDILANKFAGLWGWDTPTNLKEKINDLKRKCDVLNALKEDMIEELKRSEEQHPRKKRKKEVELWFRYVERKMGELQDLDQKIGESNFLYRGFQKRNVVKMIQEVEELFQQGKSHQSSMVDNPKWIGQVKSHDSLMVDNPKWIGQALSMTTFFGEAAKICMEEIWGYLMDDAIQKIGVWGMGGIGKTTIMKLIHNQLLKETGKFDIVIWITVSKEMNIFNMQNKIARAIKEALDEDEDETIRAGQIHEMLARRGKYVLILDDLWHELSLEEVGIPEPSNGSKLVVTTRLLNVCYYLDCRAVKAPTLSKQDAWSLFLEKVGRDVLNRRDLLPFVESVAEECAGLPLAIITIASSMKGVRDIHVWRNAFHELNRRVKSVNGMEEKVFQQLQFSYDRLGDEKVKQCFLYCALYPEDWGIDIYELINFWIDEGLVEEMDSMQTEIDKGGAILGELINSCLVEYLDGKVKLHDVARDMALRITSVRPRFLVKAGMQLNEILNVQDWNEDLEKVSLMMNGKLQIPSQIPPLKCQNLTTLLLSACSIESIPKCFFEQMHGLKVLDLSSNYCIKSLPNSISNLETLTTLLLGGCWDLENVPSVSKLEALKKLDLGGTKIKEIPDGMERLVNLKYLDLRVRLDLRDSVIEKIPDGILGKLTSLRYLALGWDTLVRGEEIGGLRKLESYAGGTFYDLKELNNYARASEARIKTPSKYSIRVGACTCKGLFRWEECLIAREEKGIVIHGGDIISTDDSIKVPSDVEELVIDNCTVKLCEEGAFLSRFIPTPPDIFSSLSQIKIRKCKNIKKLFSSNWLLHNLSNLKELYVSGCEDIEEIIALEPELEEERISGFKFTLPKLRGLTLIDLPELKSICSANGVMVCDSIEEITISNCPKLKRIPLNLPLQDDGQPSPPPSLRRIWVPSMEWWESVEWDHPNDKSLLEPYVREVGQKDAFGMPALYFNQNTNQVFDQDSDQDGGFFTEQLGNVVEVGNTVLGFTGKHWKIPTGLDQDVNKLKRKREELNRQKEDTKDLKRKLENLNSLKEVTESRMRAEQHPRKKLKKEVQPWLGNVDRVNGEVQNLEQRVGESSAVLRGFQTGHVLKKIQEAEELLQQGKFQDGLVIDDTQWIGQALLTTNLVGVAAEDYLQKIWQSLMDDEVQKIGVRGMGGVGKTTLMKVINNRLLKETNKFDVVIWVTVSKEMSILKLQDDIADKLKATLSKGDDEITRAGMLSDLLAQKGRFVIILDDVWEKFSLERVGIPETSNGSKLLLTTRSLDVCRCMGCRVINMKPLAEEDAWNLFLEKLGSDILSYPDLKPFMESVAKHCAGLPLAITTIASSMMGIYDLYEWRNAQKELTSRVQSVNGWENEIFHQLQFSYNHLRDPKLQHCFLTCALYPEDSQTREVDLISLWTAEGLVEEMDSRQAEFDRGRSMLNRLINSCLLETVEGDCARYVKMHDLMRDMALRVTSVRPRFLVKARLGLTKPPDVQEWSEDLEKVSLMENYKLQIPSEIIPPKCPMLTTLLMSYCAIDSIPECFFQHMPQLKILDLSGNPFKELPNSISDLTTLTRLTLRFCDHLEKVPSLSKLGALKDLDLLQSNIKALPHGIEELLNLSDLNLSGIQDLEEVPNGIVSKFPCLRRLMIGPYTFISAEEVAGLRKLEIFEGSLKFNCMMDHGSILEDLDCLKEGRCQYIIYYEDKDNRWREEAVTTKGCIVYSLPGDNYTNQVMLPPNFVDSVDFLEIRDCQVDCFEDCSWFIPPSDSFDCLTTISIVKCRKIEELFSIDWMLQILPNLRAIFVEDCEKMEEILVSESELEEEGMGSKNTITFTLPSLMELQFENLPGLKDICSAIGLMDCDSLKRIRITNCPNLKRIPLHLPLRDGLPCLPPSLQEIWIEPKELWESLEWDHPNTKLLLEPLVHRNA